MAALVTLAQAKDQLSITHSDQDVFVQMKLDEAHALVLQYCDKAPVEGWDALTVPLEVRSAILDVVTDLYTDRGDLDRPASRTPSLWDGFPTPAVRGKLIRWHALVVA
jgi:Phage gp6-like head-tail connector protein